jgi:hypothetical protein
MIGAVLVCLPRVDPLATARGSVPRSAIYRSGICREPPLAIAPGSVPRSAIYQSGICCKPPLAIAPGSVTDGESP